MEKIKALCMRHREMISYLFFGGLTTLVNIVGFWLLTRADLPTGQANGIALTVSILFAYVTNRLWVFESRAHGAAALREFASFIACRLGTGLVDQGVVVFGVDHLGPVLIPAAYAEPWSLVVKIFANVLVILLNYVFSKLIIFRKKA